MNVPLSLFEARRRNICRVCMVDALPKPDNPLVLNYGKEYAHQKCLQQLSTVKQDGPYILHEELVIVTRREHNPNYGQKRICQCGHTYERHFDTYEKMAAVGCKYCPCDTFVE